MADVEIKSRDKLSHHEPLLVGRVYIVQPTPRDRPRLELSVWCPHCKLCHLHRWLEPPYSSDVAIHVRPICKIGPWLVPGYWIALDRTRMEINSRAYKDATKLFAEWHRANPGEAGS